MASVTISTSYQNGYNKTHSSVTFFTYKHTSDLPYLIQSISTRLGKAGRGTPYFTYGGNNANGTNENIQVYLTAKVNGATDITSTTNVISNMVKRTDAYSTENKGFYPVYSDCTNYIFEFTSPILLKKNETLTVTLHKGTNNTMVYDKDNGATINYITPAARIYDGNQWKYAIPYVYTDTWQQAIPYVYNGTEWKQSGG